MKKTSRFKELKSQPLEKQEVLTYNKKSDDFEVIPSLHPDLCKQKLSGNFYTGTPLLDPDKNINLNHCMSMIDSLITEFEWVLSLSHAQFWCQVLYDEGLHATLDSYLKHAPRFKQPHWTKELQNKHDALHRLIFMVFLRMSTPKESAEHFISPVVYGDIIYKHFLFDIPRLLDLCSLYGRAPSNRPLLRKMVESVFKHQPRYYEDLGHAAGVVFEVLSDVNTRCSGRADTGAKPNRLSSGRAVSPLEAMSEQEFSDIVLYLSDSFQSLQVFLGVIFPPACQAFHQAGALEKLATLHTLVTRDVRAALRDRQLATALHRRLRAHLRRSRAALLSVAHAIVDACLLRPVVGGGGSSEAERADDDDDATSVEAAAASFFHGLSSITSEHRFLTDLNKNFNLVDDVMKVVERCPECETQAQFILGAIDHVPREPAPSIPADRPPSVPIPVVDETKPAAAGSGDAPAPPASDDVATTSWRASDFVDDEIEVTSSASLVLDLFPALDFDFVKSCLRFFRYDAEKVVQVLLDDDLPHDLRQLQRDSEATKPPPDHAAPPTVGELRFPDDDDDDDEDDVDYVASRANVFAGDDFDVFASSSSSQLDMTRVHRGKSEKADAVTRRHWKADVADGGAREVERIKDLYSKYVPQAGGVGDDLPAIPVNSNVLEYDDEYDDTYDEQNVGANDADSGDERLVLIQPELRSSRDQWKRREENGDDDEDGNQQHERQRRNDFVRNPEVVRAEKEAKRQAAAARRGGGRPSHPPRGGGSEQRTEHERRRKEQNKARSGNHNRKNFAQRKVAGAMR